MVHPRRPNLSTAHHVHASGHSRSERTVDYATRRPERRAVFIQPMSKRRRGFPSESHVKRGVQIVHGDKELVEKLGRNDPCPCGSGNRFKKCCLKAGRF
jgi:uncharacterized protein YchJ